MPNCNYTPGPGQWEPHITRELLAAGNDWSAAREYGIQDSANASPDSARTVMWKGTAMSTAKRLIPLLALAACLTATAPARAADATEVFVRFKMLEPTRGAYYVRMGGYIHNSPWYLPRTVWPERADKDRIQRTAAGKFTPWLNFSRYAGKCFHGRLHRAGGMAEFPNVTVDFVADPTAARRKVVVEIAVAPRADAVAKRFVESYVGSLTSFTISPDPKRDAAELETAGQMTARRLAWARQATGGKRVSPKHHIIQTSFWSPQREELNLKEAQVLSLLGFNVVGNQRPEVRKAFDLRKPGHTHRVAFGPAATREQIDDLMKKHAERQSDPFAAGVPFGFTDEMVCRPRIGTDPAAVSHFHAWLKVKGIAPRLLGVRRLADVVPIETPEVFRQRAKTDEHTARRVFYYTSRFRQESNAQRVRWHTDLFHKHFGPEARTSTLVADHPYFGGTGLGMGMTPNSTWGGAPLAADWFLLARTRAVDLIGIEDWMGLQYMYGPNSTWEGFQLMGFQASIFRSGSRGEMPIIAWITPSDETNLRLKSASALCQGAKHFFYWTYGPTATSTENYWSDLRSAYDGVASVARQLAAAEHIVAPGKVRKTRIALLYSISSDLWQPFGYVHMLERRLTYFSLIHDQYLVDMLTEEDIDAGRLKDYDVLYATDPCVKTTVAAAIAEWVARGGTLHGSCGAGSFDEFGRPAKGLNGVFGIREPVKTTVQPGRYHIRGALNAMKFLDTVRVGPSWLDKGETSFGAIGTRTSLKLFPLASAVGMFTDGSPAVLTNRYGKGRAVYTATCPAISYAKDARFVPRELKEAWPAAQRRFINAVADYHPSTPRGPSRRLVELSHPVVEAGIYDAKAGTALVLANFTYKPIKDLRVTIRLPKACKTVRSVTHGAIKFSETTGAKGAFPRAISFTVSLGLNDIILIE